MRGSSAFVRSLPRAALLVLSAALVVGALLGPTTTTAAPQATTYDFTQVTTIMQNAVTTIPLQGASLRVVKDSVVVYEQAFGAYTTSTSPPIASASKWLSAAVIMSLVEDGLIDLDEPVSTYLPQFTGLKGTMTVRQMFSHTSGLPGDHNCRDNHTITLANCVDQIALVSLQAAPGALFDYGGVSMHVAGRVAEVVSGQSWAQLFEDRIRAPLGLTNTYYFNATPDLNPSMAGGARSTLGDYGKFLAMILADGNAGGVQVLTPASVHEMQIDQTAGAAGANPRGYGLGEWRDIVDNQDNATQLSSAGAFGFVPWIDTERNYYAVFLTYDHLDNVRPTVNQLETTIRAIFDAPPSPPPVGGVAHAPEFRADRTTAVEEHPSARWVVATIIICAAAMLLIVAGFVWRRERPAHPRS